MFTQLQIARAALHWYGNTLLDACCLAENRLMRGEVPTCLTT